MPRMPWATRAQQRLGQWDATPKGEANPLNPTLFRLRAVTRPHDAGISSNQSLSHSGEYVPAPCTHRPSNHSSRVLTRIDDIDHFESRPCKKG